MTDFSNVGKLMHLPLVDIKSDEKTSEPEFIMTAAADSIRQADGRNWVPLIVQEIGDYQYQVVSNHFIYAVAQQADLERVWCIVVAPEPKIIEQAKVLSREVTPKINLSTASRESIFAALRYLTEKAGNPLKGVDVLVATNRIESADRAKWADFNPIIKLKCGITKGKKLDALSEVFFLSPPPPPPPPPETVSVKSASRDEIFERLNYLSTQKIGGFEAIDVEKVSDLIFAANKAKWKSLNRITKLDPDIDISTAQLKALKTVLSL